MKDTGPVGMNRGARRRAARGGHASVRMLPSASSVLSFVSLTGLLLALSVSDARAEIVFFSTGRTLSIKEHMVDPADDGKLILTLRSGGEIVCEPSIIDRIVPDEVPYPEPEEDKPVVVAAGPRPAGKKGRGTHRGCGGRGG